MIPTLESVTTDESGTEVTRTFTTVTDLASGVIERNGPDGHVLRNEFDSRGLPASVERRDGETVLMSATVDEYDPDGLVKQVSYGNGARTLYEYDNARRLTKITHQRNCEGPTAMLTLEYEYTPDGLIQTIEETDAGPGCTSDPVQSTVSFTYDHRNRLVAEQRTGGAVEYGIGYAYDQNGNRVLKTIGSDTVVEYIYDLDGQYGSKANRLMAYTVLVDSQEVEKVRYAYDGFGHASRIVRHDIPADEVRATNFYYSTSGRLWMVLDQTWDVNSNGEAVNCQNVKLREFRYDSGRRRYLLRERAVTSPYAPISSQWTDYDGDGPWLDYTLSGAAATAVNEYVAGLAQRIVGESDTVYFHGDQIGTSRVLTDDAGVPARRVVYTAFGEPIYSEPPAQAGGPTRYLYAGAWGYENFNDAAFPYLHVGERWYDPATGRFLQRDPIGIRGGMNVYLYVGADPAAFVDPYGMGPIDWLLTGEWSPTPKQRAAAQRAFTESVHDRSLGTADAAVSSVTCGWVTGVGGHTYDSANRANADKWATRIIGTTEMVTGAGGVKSLTTKAIRERKLLWEVIKKPTK